MKNKNQIINRIGAVLCALVVLVGSFGTSSVFYAYESEHITKDDMISESDGFTQDFSCVVSCIDVRTNKENTFTFNLMGSDDIVCVVGKEDIVYTYSGTNYDVTMGTMYFFSKSPLYCSNYNGQFYYRITLDNGEVLYCYTYHLGIPQQSGWSVILNGNINFNGYYEQSPHNSSLPLLALESGLVEFGGGTKFDSSIGYLQNMACQTLYLRGALYNYDEDSRMDKWTYGNLTSGGIDLSQGGYTIRHYIQPNLVSGYKLEDVIESYDKYLVGEYDASSGVIEYLRTDVESIMASQGYDGIGFVDAYLKGRFILEHHLFQVVDTSSGAVGPLLRVRPNDEKGTLVDSVEDYFDFDSNEENTYVTDGLTPNGEIDAEYEKDYVDRTTGSGESYEDAEEQAQTPNLTLSGVNEFSNVIRNYSQQILNVSSGIGSFLGALPSWVVVCLGLSVCLFVIGMIVKSLRG